MTDKYLRALIFLTRCAAATKDENFSNAVEVMWELYNEKDKIRLE